MGRRRLLIVAAAALIVTGLVAASARYVTSVPGEAHSGPLPALTDAEAATASRLGAHIHAIASRPRNIEHHADLEKAASYIERELRALGHHPVPQIYRVDGRDVRNIEVVIEPAAAHAVRGSVIVGAHYDSYGDAPGANDNATGTAAVIELARLLADLNGRSTARIRLVLFVNEEPPYFKTPDMGSHRYARLLAERGEPVIGMISLETLGSFSDEPGSQGYPPPLGLLYPSTGNFIAFVATPPSREWMQALIGSFRRHTEFPTVGGAAPGFIPGIDWSDHWSFDRHRYPAVMITDTAIYRYAHYHRPTDTPDKIDTGKLARITHGVERMVRDAIRPDWPTAASRPSSAR